jgi:hypothetical protein
VPDSGSAPGSGACPDFLGRGLGHGLGHGHGLDLLDVGTVRFLLTC